MSIDNNSFKNTIVKQDPDNEKSYAELLGVPVPEPLPEKLFLGVCPECDADVFADKAHVEVTTIYVFDDKTARTNADYLHMTCYKFGGK